MRLHPLRRGQVIAPFGVGAMNTYPDGVSLMVAGLDAWFPDRLGIEVEEFKVEEWRLSRRLGVEHFRLPPDYRDRSNEAPNTGIRLPAVRFPQAHACTWCSTLESRPLSNDAGRIECATCRRANKYGRLVQVQIVVACRAGHIQDFPWREWCHRTSRPKCDGALRVTTTGTTATLGSTRVTCECGATRTLAEATGLDAMDVNASSEVTAADAKDQMSTLSSRLDPDQHFLCQGRRPWLGEESGHSGCRRPLHLTLRSAINSYYADVRTAIYVPSTATTAPPALVELLRREPMKGRLQTLIKVSGGLVGADRIRLAFESELKPFSDGEVDEVVASLAVEWGLLVGTEAVEPEAGEGEQAFRLSEAHALRIERDDPDLTVRRVLPQETPQAFGRLLAGISLVDRLRVTRAFVGFSRLDGLEEDEVRGVNVRRDLLWRGRPESWLPAAVIYGEGILLEFEAERMQAWARTPSVVARRDLLVERFLERGGRQSAVVEEVTAPYIALHTLAHLLVLELAFYSGYSATSMSERVYVDAASDTYSILVYTAAGDSEGTMGGLVRLGRTDRLEPLLRRAIERAEWCSIDPVCAEVGDDLGQGPYGCNLAACYACAIVPETTCDDFNRFLDRRLLADQEVGLLRSMDA